MPNSLQPTLTSKNGIDARYVHPREAGIVARQVNRETHASFI